MKKIAVHVIVHGVVQGVGFRYFARQQAQSLGLGGFVRNLPDGTVEALIEGEESQVKIMLGHLRQGPFGGRVDRLEVEPVEYTGSYHGFNISF